jgi:hypothetical protein
MLVALGFALAILLVLLFGRTFWNMAMRLGARRQAKQVPTAMLDLQADRDRLRVEHAMMSHKLELRLEDIKTRMTEQMAEVSRHRNRIQTMVQDIERRDEVIKIRDRELEALTAQIEMSKADLGTYNVSMEKLNAELANKDAKLAKQAAVIAQLSSNLQEKNELVNNLGQEMQTNVRMNGSHSAMASETSESRFKQRIAKLSFISSEISQERESSPFTASPVAPLNDYSMKPLEFETRNRQVNVSRQLANAERESVDMTEQLRALDAMMTAPPVRPAPVPAPTESKKSGAMANVISLAQRIRALQRVNE